MRKKRIWRKVMRKKNIKNMKKNRWRKIKKMTKKRWKKRKNERGEREGEYIPSYPTDGYPISYILSLSGCSRRTQVTRKHLTSEKSNLFSRRILTLFPKNRKKESHSERTEALCFQRTEKKGIPFWKNLRTTSPKNKCY